MARVQLMQPFARLAGAEGFVETAGLTVEEVLRSLCAAYPDLAVKFLREDGSVRAHVMVHLEGRYVRPEEYGITAVTSHTQIKISAVLAGG